MFAARRFPSCVKRSVSTLAYPVEQGIQPFLSPRALETLHSTLLPSLVARIQALHPNPPPLLDLVRNTTDPILRHHASLALNMDFFLRSLTPTPTDISTDLLTRLNSQFGDVDAFKRMFQDTAMGIFGPGYVWLCEDKRKHTLHVVPTFHAASPWIKQTTLSMKQEKDEEQLKESKLRPLLGLSVWEHAYMVDYGVTGKEEYINQFWKVVDWKQVRDRMSITSV